MLDLGQNFHSYSPILTPRGFGIFFLEKTELIPNPQYINPVVFGHTIRYLDGGYDTKRCREWNRLLHING